MSVAVLDEHLHSCPACRAWLEEAIRLGRSARMASVQVPDLTGQILARVALTARRGRRRVTWLRAALLLAGAVQLAVALPAVFGDSIAMAMGPHAAHESAAWNAAVGAALVITAWRPRRAYGLIPILAVFVALLVALSVRDLRTGAVSVDRLATHLGSVVGLALVIALAEAVRDLPPDPLSAEETGPGAVPAQPAPSHRIRGVA